MNRLLKRRRPALLLAAVVLSGTLLVAVPLGAAAPAALPLVPCTLPGGVVAQCGTFVVPEDRARPGGRTISLRVAVVPARDGATKRDPVVHLSGGPGGSAVADATGVVSVLYTLNESRDFVFLDQRGTGGSNSLACPPPRADLDITDAAEVRAYVRSCVEGLNADPSQYTTAPAMDDFADVLHALGYEQVNVVAGSYGATAAQYLLVQHPELVRTAVLDGATLLDVPIFELWGRNGQRALTAVLLRCARSRPCRARYPRVRREVYEALAVLRRKAVRRAGVRLDEAAAAEAIQSLTRSPAAAAQIPWVAHRARSGDWTPLARAAKRAEAGAPRLLMYWSIVCNEPWARWNPGRTALASRGTYLARATAFNARLVAVVCSVMPKAEQPAWSRARVRSDTPVLFTVGGADPQDPVSNVANAARELPESRTVVVPGGGHGVGHLGCVPRLIVGFVDRGTAAGLDARCVAQYRPPKFVLR